MVPIFFVHGRLRGRGCASWEGRLTERMLPEYVRAGWLSPPEVAALGTLGRRHSARRWARRVAGDAGVKAMRGFQFAATRLALLRDGMRRGLDSTPADRQRGARGGAAAAGRDRRVPAGLRRPRPADAAGAAGTAARYHITFPDGVRAPWRRRRAGRADPGAAGAAPAPASPGCPAATGAAGTPISLQVEAGGVGLDPAGGDGVHVPLAQQDVFAAVQLHLGAVVRVEEHPVAGDDRRGRAGRPRPRSPRTAACPPTRWPG